MLRVKATKRGNASRIRRAGLQDVVLLRVCLRQRGDHIQDHANTEEDSVRMLIVRDSLSKVVFAHVVPTKGIEEQGFAVDAIRG